jgi:hypothetical protein
VTVRVVIETRVRVDTATVEVRVVVRSRVEIGVVTTDRVIVFAG